MKRQYVDAGLKAYVEEWFGRPLVVWEVAFMYYLVTGNDRSSHPAFARLSCDEIRRLAGDYASSANGSTPSAESQLG